MGLSEQERQKIIEEEQLRAEVREKSKPNALKKDLGCFGYMIVLIPFVCLVAFFALSNLGEQVEDNLDRVGRFYEFEECFDKAGSLETEQKLCVEEYEDVLTMGYENCKKGALGNRTEEFKNRELAECETSWGSYLKMLN